MGIPYPNARQTVSASALSRFLNSYKWSCRTVIRAVRQEAVQQILAQKSLGRRPTLQVILDMTSAGVDREIQRIREFGTSL